MLQQTQAGPREGHAAVFTLQDFLKCVSPSQNCLKENLFHSTLARKYLSEIYLTLSCLQAFVLRSSSFPPTHTVPYSSPVEAEVKSRCLSGPGQSTGQWSRLGGWKTGPNPLPKIPNCRGPGHYKFAINHLWQSLPRCHLIWQQKLIRTDERLLKAFIYPT